MTNVPPRSGSSSSDIPPSEDSGRGALVDDSSRAGDGPVSRSEFLRLFSAIEGLKGQMSSMKRELVEERADANDELVKRLKLESKTVFKKKSHEKQHQFNEEVRNKLATATASLGVVPPALEKAKKALEEGMMLIAERQKLIKVADRSVHGWGTVEEYVSDELADGSDDEKRLYRAEARAGRKLNASKAMANKRNSKRKYLAKSIPTHTQSQFAPQLQNVSGPSPSGQSLMSHVHYGFNSQLNRPQLSVAGPCFMCGKMGHFRRACPLLQSAK